MDVFRCKKDTTVFIKIIGDLIGSKKESKDDWPCKSCKNTTKSVDMFQISSDKCFIRICESCLRLPEISSFLVDSRFGEKTSESILNIV
jgi:hypothetical protein